MASVKSSLCLMSLMTIVASLAGCDGQSTADADVVAQDDVLEVGVDETTRVDDALIAPAQPRLQIGATPETLILTWEVDRSDQLANIYQYDASNGEESLVHSGITAQTNSFSVPSHAPSRRWHAQQFRVELCDSQDCVSSERVAISPLMAATTQTLRPAVFMRGERFAKSVTTSDDASLIVSTLPTEGAIQIHFHIRKQWVAADPVRLDMAISSSLLDVASSNTGDTLAVLIRDSSNAVQAGSLRILERLGEAWIQTAELSVPAVTTLDSQTHLTLSSSADRVSLHTTNNLYVYEQDNIDWSLQSTLPAPPEGSWATSFNAASSNRIYAILRQSSHLWLVLFQWQGEADAAQWRESYRHLIQGIASDDHVFIQGDDQGSSMLIAGWDGTVREERSPVLWRYRFDETSLSGSEPALLVADSFRMAPTLDGNAELRFAASDSLDTVALGWHSPNDDDAQLSTFTFNAQDQRYRAALELPQDLSTLAKQSFARDIALSGDGKTLLVSTIPGGATPSTNRAGELLILR
ncbi:MAG: hypothetical protein AB8B64_08610 [Granulosicoccus sp.]